MKLIRFTCLIVSIMLLASCSIRQADLTAITTRNVKLDGVNLNSLSGNKVEGKDSALMLLFFPIGYPQLEDAIDDALDKGEGDLMLNPVIYTSGWWFLIGENTITVKGEVVNTMDLIKGDVK